MWHAVSRFKLWRRKKGEILEYVDFGIKSRILEL